MVGEEGSVKGVDRSFGKVSVVQIAPAVVNHDWWEPSRFSNAFGIAEMIFWIGRRCLMKNLSFSGSGGT